jgi:hypothetical protein
MCPLLHEQRPGSEGRAAFRPLLNIEFVDDAHADIKQRKLPFSILERHVLRELIDVAYPFP